MKVIKYRKLLSLGIGLVILNYNSYSQNTPRYRYASTWELKTDLSVTIDQENYIARDYIQMLPGFRFKPGWDGTNGTFSAKILPDVFTNVVYVNPVGADTRPLNPLLQVGATPMTINVSPNGGASCDIPIQVPPGSGGVTPTVSINYNSMAGTGLLGIGWNIAGLSAITRTGKTIYHDGVADGVRLDTSDRFMVDGNRLISVSGSYGANGTEYRTEAQSFSKIISNGSPATGPLSFIVQTKDGRTLEYGVTSDSRVDANVAGKSEVVTWNINKITDQSGNIIFFHYHKDNAKREYWPERIIYGTNSIEFLYESVASTANSYYVAGSEQRQFILLRKIRTYAGSDKAKEYQFKYSLDFYSHLSEVIEYGYDGSYLNSTLITWGAASENLVPGVPSFVSPFESHMFADFNGDSKTDMISFPKKAVYSPADKWHLYLNNGVTFDLPKEGSFNDSSEAFLSSMNAGVVGLNTQDINGDGKDDLLLTEKVHRSACTSCPSLKALKVSPLLSTGTGFSPATYSLLPIVYDAQYGECVPGDFDGDGLLDILINDTWNNTWKIYFLHKNTSDEGTNFSIDKLSTGDFNGNGRTDLISTGTMGMSYIKLVEYDPASGTMKTLFSSGLHEYLDYSTYLPGDYNGDGKTDLLLRADSTFDYEYWEIQYFDGIKFRKNNPLVKVGKYDVHMGDRGNVFAGDFNGDGKCDIVQIDEISAQSGVSSNLIINYSRGLSFERKTVPFRTDRVRDDSFHPGDFNGDGKMDLYHVRFMTHMGTRYQFSPNEQKHLVHSIANGFNNRTRFTYKPLTDPLVYTKEAVAIYPLQDYVGPTQVVEKMISDDGAGASNITSYTYLGAKIHRLGKGFLGFMAVTATNEKLERTSSTNNELDSYFNMRPKTATVKSLLPGGSQNISTTTYTNAVKTYTGKIHFPYASQIKQNDHLKSIILTTDYTYDNFGNITTQKITHHSDGITTTTTSYEAAGAWCISKPNFITVTKTRTGQPAYTRETDYSYGANGKPSQMILDPGKANSVTHTYSYDSYGNMTNDSWSASGLATRSLSYGYDPEGRFVTSETNSLGQGRTMTRDPRDGNILTLKDENLHVTINEFDGWGRVKKMTAPTGAIITYEYKWTIPSQNNSLYAVVTTPEGKPQVTEYYDLFKRKVKTETIGFNGMLTQKEWVYNGKGQLSSESKPHSLGDAKLITYQYDDKGRLKLQVNGVAIYTFEYNGRKATVKNEKADQVTSKTINAFGDIVLAEDAAGSIQYNYYSSGNPKDITAPDGAVISMEYDIYGRQKKLIDPDAGITEYSYNAYGELESQTDQKGNIFTMTYDQVGRNITKTGPEGVYTSTYDNRTKGIGKIGTVEGPNGYKTEYFYDTKSRLNEVKETPNNPSLVLTTRYVYDIYNNVIEQTYPSGLTIENSYDANGYLTEVKQPGVLVPIWKGLQQNARGQWESYVYGNAQSITRTYDIVTGAPASYTSNAISATGGDPIINLVWDFDDATGNLLARTEGNLVEAFTYDKLNRLETLTTGGVTLQMGYGVTGNITSKPHTGEYTYGAGSAGPHAVTQVNNTGFPAIPAYTQDIAYTAFNKIETIEEDAWKMEFYYGADQERRKTELYENGTLIKTKYYSINYERIETAGDIRHVSYIPAGDGLAAIHVTDNSGSKLYYVHKDYLNSILLITDELGIPKESYSYDAWGRRRDPLTGTYNNMLPVSDPVTDRGYTGHEHMAEFGLINMNGRLYDPVLGRMLSPDNLIQEAGFSQNYNRYSYAWNNPLSYVDPDGNEIVTILVAGLIYSGIVLLANVLDNMIDGGMRIEQAIDAAPKVLYLSVPIGGGGGSSSPGTSPVMPEEETGPPIATGYEYDPTYTASSDYYAGLLLPEPAFNDLWNNWPGESYKAKDVYKLIGGNALYNFEKFPNDFENSCTMRASYAFNKSGYGISKRAGQTISGKNNDWNYYRVTDFKEFMVRNFGQPDVVSNNKSAFIGHKGVILFQVSGWTNATGHFDIWNGNTVKYNEYFQNSYNIMLWKFK